MKIPTPSSSAGSIQSRQSGPSLASLMLNENLSLHATRINSPPALSPSSLPCGGGVPVLTSLKLMRGNKEEIWTTVLASQSTCMCGTQIGDVGDRLSSSRGVIAIGCMDGTLQVLELGSGIRITSPMVLGATVTYVDSIVMGGGVVRLVAMTAHGDTWCWEIGQPTGKFRCILKENVRPVLVAMKCDHKGTPRDMYDVNIESCKLSASGLPVIYVRCRGALGGDWQAFAYSEDMRTWTRVADLRHVMSHLFDLSSYKTNIAMMNRDPSRLGNIKKKYDEGGGGYQPTISTLESAAASEGGFTVRDVMAVARAGQDTNGSTTTAQWTDLITLSHAEERMASISSCILGGTLETLNEALKVSLGEWITMCCRVGYAKRVLYVSNILLRNARDKSKQKSGQINHNSLTNELENMNTSLGWLLSCSSQESMDLLTNVVLPCIGKTGTLINLLGDLHEQLEELKDQ